MRALVAGLILVPLADQALKLALRSRGLKMLKTRIWLARRGQPPTLAGIWIVWLPAAVAVGLLGALAPSSGWFAGLLLGGSLSHALESSMRGGVSDYVCLRFWPAFNLADVAITVGAIGVLLTTFTAMKGLWS